MHLTLRQLAIFVAVADSGSTTAAGAQIALSQSATSAALNELEAMLGTRLFDRVGKRLALNDRGRALLPQARAVLDATRTVERQFGVGAHAAQHAPAHLRLAASTTIGNYLLPERIARYRAQHPQATIDLVIGNTQAVAEAVARFEVDLGFVEGPCAVAGLHVEAWQDDTLVIVCAPDHPLAQTPEPCTLDALKRATWLLREPGSGTRAVTEQALLLHLNHLASVIQLGSTEAIKQAAACGLGLSCLSLCAVQDLLALGRLQILATPLAPLTRQFTVLRHHAKPWSDAMRALLALPPLEHPAAAPSAAGVSA